DFVGTVIREKERLYFLPDECPFVRLQVKKSAAGGASDGDKAAVELLSRGGDYEDHRVGVALRFGSAQAAKNCAKALLYAAGVDRHFPEKVKAEARKLEGIQSSDLKKRTDLRSWPIFTIDADSTKIG